MPNRTSNSIILLNFNDPDKPLYDECGNTWTATNPQLVYDKELGRYVANFKNGITNGLNSSPINVNLSGSDYTIECYFKIEDTQNNGNSAYSCLLCNNNHRYIGNFIKHNKAVTLQNNSDDIDTKELSKELVYSWIHLVIVYEDLFSIINVYIDGKKEYTYTSVPKIINKTDGFGIGCISKTNSPYYFNGRMAFVHFSKGALYSSNFDYDYIKQAVYNKPVYTVHTESNTKRMYVFTYGWNVQRETKWNQKANMYVMNPDHHISQGKKE